jgi:hypothetical protein
MGFRYIELPMCPYELIAEETSVLTRLKYAWKDTGVGMLLVVAEELDFCMDFVSPMCMSRRDVTIGKLLKVCHSVC